MSTNVNEQTILDALRQVPQERWDEVLTFLHSLKGPESQAPAEEGRIMTAADILNSGMVGMWADRDDFKDNHEFARKLRHQASRRNRNR